MSHCENFIVDRSAMTSAPNYRSLMGRYQIDRITNTCGDCTESDGKRERERERDSQKKGAECRMDAIIVYVER